MTSGICTQETTLPQNNPQSPPLLMPSIMRPTSPSPSSPPRVSAAPSAPYSSSPNASMASYRIPSGGPSGKSTQHIERLTREVDALKREARSRETSLQQAQADLQASKAIEADMRDKNEQLVILHESHDRMIKRKDRQIEELRGQLAAEAARRAAAATREDEMSQELDRVLTETKRQIAEAETAQRRAEAHAEALRDGIKRLEGRYESQVQRIRKDLEEVKRSREADSKRLAALEVCGDQQHQEKARADSIVAKMAEQLEQMKLEWDTRLQALEEEARGMRQGVQKHDDDARTLLDQLAAARDKMNWVMSMKEHQQQQQQQK